MPAVMPFIGECAFHSLFNPLFIECNCLNSNTKEPSSDKINLKYRVIKIHDDRELLESHLATISMGRDCQAISSSFGVVTWLVGTSLST